MAKPLLRQYADLTARDFANAPVWIGCHTADYDEPWYDETDEETFRPYDGRLPASPEDGMLLVRAWIILNDGTRLPGFATPAFPDESADGDRALGTQQPMAFTPAGQVRFWFGGFEPQQDAVDYTYRALGRDASAVFPLRFSTEPGLTSGNGEGVVNGFYWLKDFMQLMVRT
jgi:hypothetical protein